MISIVTTTYNSKDHIGKYLKSLENNSHLINKVVILENNSPEAEPTRKIIKKFQNKSKIKIEYIKNESNLGFGKSCNYGASKVSSEYTLFLNPDTELKENSLKILIQHAKKTKADIIGGLALDYNGNKHRTAVRHPDLSIGLFEFTNLGKLTGIQKGTKKFYYEDRKILSSKTDKVVNACSGAYLLIKTASFKALRGFDENFFMYLEDVDIGYRANCNNMKVVFCPHSKIKHIGGASSKNKYRIRKQAWFDSRKYYFKKHYGFLTNLIIQTIFMLEETILKKFDN